MKNKMYIVISLLVNIIYSVYMIVIANDIVRGIIDTYREMFEMYPEGLSSRFDMIINMFEKNGMYLVVGGSIIVIGLSVVMMMIVLMSKDFARKKGWLITFSLICVFVTQADIVLLLSIVNIVLFAKSRVINPDEREVKKEIPRIDKGKVSKREVIYAIVMMGIYFVLMMDPFGVYALVPREFSLVLMIGIYLLLMVLALVFNYKELKYGFDLFRKNFKTYVRYVLPKLGIMYLSYLVVSLLVFGLYKGTTVNQQSIEALPKLLAFFLSVIYAPLVEEVVFRGAVRKLIRNDILYIIVSGLIFGLVHTIGEDSFLSIIVLAIPYSVLGGFFAYLYVKTNNLSNNIACHAVHNFVASLPIMFM